MLPFLMCLSLYITILNEGPVPISQLRRRCVFLPSWFRSRPLVFDVRLWIIEQVSPFSNYPFLGFSQPPLPFGRL